MKALSYISNIGCFKNKLSNIRRANTSDIFTLLFFCILEQIYRRTCPLDMLKSSAVSFVSVRISQGKQSVPVSMFRSSIVFHNQLLVKREHCLYC